MSDNDMLLVKLGRIKGAAHLLAALKHNKRTLYADGNSGNGIDSARSQENYRLAGAETPTAVVKVWEELRAAAGLFKPKRSDEVSAIEVIFSLRPDTKIALEPYFRACTAWAATTFGGESNLLSSDVHLDQAQPHCHVLMLPLVDGKMCGSDLYWGDSRNRTQLYRDFHLAVGEKYGLQPGRPRLKGQAKSLAAKLVHEKLRACGDDSERWAATRNATFRAIDRDPESFMADMGVLTPEVPQSQKTLKQIALSTGRGPKTEAGQVRRDIKLLGQNQSRSLDVPGTGNPIGFNRGADAGTLSCVGFDENAAPQPTTDSVPRPSNVIDPSEQDLAMGSAESPSSYAHEATVYKRERESDRDPSDWDATLGEFHAPRPALERKGKAAAQATVAALLARMKVAVVTPCDG